MDICGDWPMNRRDAISKSGSSADGWIDCVSLAAEQAAGATCRTPEADAETELT